MSSLLASRHENFKRRTESWTSNEKQERHNIISLTIRRKKKVPILFAYVRVYALLIILVHIIIWFLFCFVGIRHCMDVVVMAVGTYRPYHKIEDFKSSVKKKCVRSFFCTLFPSLPLSPYLQCSAYRHTWYVYKSWKFG